MADSKASAYSIRLDELISEFEAAWRSRRRPEIRDYLPGEDESPDSTWRRELLTELVLIDLEWRWRSETSPADSAPLRFGRLEDYVDEFPEFGPAERLPVSIVCEEYRVRRNWGDRPGHDEFLRRFPGQKSQPDRETELRAELERVDRELAREQRRQEPDVPRRLGRYDILERVGSGGFGLVFRARDEELSRDVAIKVPYRERVSTPDDQARFLAEARTIAGLDHPSIVPVYDFGRTDEGLCYVVTKYIDGAELTARIGAESRSFREIAGITADVAEALHHAHLRGITHRDVKPANILLDADNNAYVTDFGLAARESDTAADLRLAGTPSYMSPEQARGEGHRLDGRTDIFSLGIVLYELLTGRKPFRGDSTREVLELVKHVEPRPPRQLDDSIPRELERICLKALAKRVSDRYSTAADMADDLRRWPATTRGAARGDGTVAEVNTDGAPRSVPNAASGAGVEVGSPAVVPKGLRSFEAEDADFFLELLPGPRDRDGLPDSLRFWKARIEATVPDRTFPVGMLYGPSGCGKSSLVKAGLLPRLKAEVATVYLEATPRDTEDRLLAAIREFGTESAGRAGLADVLSSVRIGGGLAAGRKLLIVIDQFEQWLHAHPSLGGEPLVDALRQCDGTHVQCLLLVRDDFWLSSCRFMEALEVELTPGRNVAVVDLFERLHAQHVLTRFGQSYGRLPDDASPMTEEQSAFVREAITGLARDERVVCVRLALFADLVKGKPWRPATLDRYGGMRGLGVTFLEESFSSRAAIPKHRLHEEAARSVLKLLLPDHGTDIKGAVRSRDELAGVSGYRRESPEFHALLRVLDSELRLITPTDPPGSGRTSRPALDSEAVEHADHDGSAYYQLTHDYLVPSLREWLTRRQRSSRRGRAELRLAERTAAWQRKPEARNLPALWELIDIGLFTRRKNWTAPERKMMSVATRRYLRTAALLALVVVIAAYAASRRLAHRNAETLVDQLLLREMRAVPAIIEQIGGDREAQSIVATRMREAVERGDRSAQTRLAMAMVVDGENPLPYLLEGLLRSKPEDVPVICEYVLERHRARLVDMLWREFDRRQGHDVQQAQAAMSLALLDPPDDPDAAARWRGIAPRVVDVVLTTTAYGPSEIEVIRRELAIVETELALPLVSRVASADTELFRRIMPWLRERAGEATPLIRRRLAAPPPIPWDDSPLSRDPDDLKETARYRLSTDGGGMLAPHFALCQSAPAEEFESLVEELGAANYRLVRLRPYVVDDAIRVAAVWRRDGIPFRFAFDQSAEAIRESHERHLDEGYSPTDVCAYRDPGTGRVVFAAVWELTPDSSVERRMYVDITPPEHPPITRKMYDANMRGLVYNKMRDDEGVEHRCVIYSPLEPNTRYDVDNGVPAESFSELHPELLQTDIDIDFAPARQYVTLHRESPEFESRCLYEQPLSRHLIEAAKLVEQGFRPVAISVESADGERPVAASVWHRPLRPIDEENERLRSRANLWISLYRLGQREQFWSLLKPSRHPGLRSLLIDRLAPLDAAPEPLIRRLNAEQDVGVRRALILAIGRYEQERVEASDARLADRLLDTFRSDPDAGIHGAAEWVLRKWGHDEQLEPRRRQTPDDDPGRRRWFRNAQGQTFVTIEAPVTFNMGSPSHEPHRHSPVREALHRQFIPRRFAVATREVTRAEFERYLNAVPEAGKHFSSTPFAPDKDCPIINLRWYQAAAYCDWLSEREGLQPVYRPNDEGEYYHGMRIAPNSLDLTGYRLLTVPEREYVCRAGAETAYCFGDDPELLSRYAWHGGNSRERSWPVGRMMPNDFGLFDVHGNALEWLHPLNKGLYAFGDVTPPEPDGGVPSGGGSFHRFPRYARCAFHGLGTAPATRFYDAGIRLARTLP